MTGPGEKGEISDDEKKLRWELYSEHKKQAWEDIQKSTDSYDQSLLTLSSAGLGLSIAFIKDLVPLQSAVWLPLLYVSWVLFVLTILFTVASFLLSVKVQKLQLEYLWKFYVGRDDSYRDKKSWYSNSLQWCTIIGGTFFLSAFICTAVFAVGNVLRYSKVNEPTKSSRLMEGRNSVAMTPLPSTGAQSNSAGEALVAVPAKVDATPCVTATPTSPTRPKKP